MGVGSAAGLRRRWCGRRQCGRRTARVAGTLAGRRRGAQARTRVAAVEEPLVGLDAAVRGDFPILRQEVAPGRPLCYLDSAATSHKPEAVIRAAGEEFYGAGGYNSNVHRCVARGVWTAASSCILPRPSPLAHIQPSRLRRGVHALSARATAAYEAAREKVARFVNASPQEIVYTRNATEAINLVANTWGAANLRAGDEVVLSVAEHHSNIVPWQLLAQRRGLVLKFAQLTASEELDIEQLATLITPRTRLVSLVHVSNMLGCVLPTQRVAEMAHAVGAKLLLDCCQSGWWVAVRRSAGERHL